MSVATDRIHTLRSRFPGLRRSLAGRACVFADAPAGTQVPEEVIEAMGGYLRHSNANLGGAFATSRESELVVDEARLAAADLLGCDATEVAFGPNTTTLILGLSRAIGRHLGQGDEIVVTVLDHDANVAPWLAVAEDTGAAIRWVDVREDDCALDLASVERALGPRTRVVAFTLASNALGTITDAEALVHRVRSETQALIVADAVHLAPHRGIDVRALDVDFLFVSAYKFFGPHLGAMFGRAEQLERWRPYKVRPAPDTVPDRWETGTQSHEALAGFTAAVDYLSRVSGEPAEGTGRRDALLASLGAVAGYEAGLSRRFLEGIAGVPGARLFGVSDPSRAAERVPTFALRLGDRHPRDVAEHLGERGVFVWDGNYYAQAIMERLGLEETGGAVRIGFCHYHTADDVDRVLEELAALAAGP